MSAARTRARLPARFACALLAAFASGWLTSGSCTVVACYEDCDPCWEQCKCSSNCEYEQATHAGSGPAAYRIASFTSRVSPDGEGRLLRVFGEIVGPALDVARGPQPTEGARLDPAPSRSDELARFARRVLAVNSDLFPTPAGARWVLDGVDLFASAGVVGFHLGFPSDASDGSRPVHSNSLSLLFDRRGRLVEVDQVFERGVR